MRCNCCHKKVGLLTLQCKSCNRNYCSRCILMETHNCEGLKENIEKGKEELQKTLVSALTSKKEKLQLE